MSSKQITPAGEYRDWLLGLKTRFRQVQLKAAMTVNTTLLQFYWELGADIVARQAGSQWGDGFLKQLATDLMQEFPEVKGFSLRNLKYIRQWYAFYAESTAIGQQPVGQLSAPVMGQQPVAPIAKQPASQLHLIPKIAKSAIPAQKRHPRMFLSGAGIQARSTHRESSATALDARFHGHDGETGNLDLAKKRWARA